MERRTTLVVVLAATATAGFLLWNARRGPAPQPVAAPIARKPFVPIQDGKTIDFSTGHAVVRENSEDRAAMEGALKEIDAANESVSFGPLTPPVTPKK